MGENETKRAARNERQCDLSDQYVSKDKIVQQVAGRIRFVRRRIRRLQELVVISACAFSIVQK